MRLAIVNPQEKTGKNNSTLALARTLVKRNKKVLIIDLDPLANLTHALGAQNSKQSMTDVLSWDERLEDVIVEAQGIDIAPADIRLAAIEISLAWTDHREIYLKTALDLLNTEYDYILINCAASLSFMTINAIYACDMAILPTSTPIKEKEDLDEDMVMTLNACEELLGTKAVKIDNHSDIYDQMLDHIGQHNKVIILEQPIWNNEDITPEPAGVPLQVGGDATVAQEILDYRVHLN